MFFFSSRRRHTRLVSDWSSDVCSSDLGVKGLSPQVAATGIASLQVPCRSLDVVKKMNPDGRALQKVLSKFGEKIVCYAFALEAERSEERRVGKERRTQRWTNEQKERRK